MMKKLPSFSKKIIKLSLVFFLICFLFIFLGIKEAKAGVNDNVWGWAWAENIGLISFNNTNTGGPIDYGAHICEKEDDPVCIANGVSAPRLGKITGYVWAGGGIENGNPKPTIGWIRLDPAGPYPDASPNYSTCLNIPNPVTTEICNSSDSRDLWKISGWARACPVFLDACNCGTTCLTLKPDSERGGWDGWIKFREGQGLTIIDFVSTAEALLYDPISNAIYSGNPATNTGIGRCSLATQDCKEAGDWTFYSSAPSIIHALGRDSDNNILYAGAKLDGRILSCLSSSGCDADGEWVQFYDAAQQQISSFAFDSFDDFMFAGIDNVIYRCSPSIPGNCASSIPIPNSAYPNALAFDSVNNVVYAGTDKGTINPTSSIYRCQTTNPVTLLCDAPGDWATYLLPSPSILSMAFYYNASSPTLSVLYAGTSDGKIYRCQVDSNCDNPADDWSLAFQAPAPHNNDSIESLMATLDNRVIYAGLRGAADEIVYYCATETGCDSINDWSPLFSGSNSGIYSLAFDSQNKVLYAASSAEGYVYYYDLMHEARLDVTDITAAPNKHIKGWALGGDLDDSVSEGVIGWVSFNSKNCDVNGNGTYEGAFSPAPSYVPYHSHRSFCC